MLLYCYYKLWHLRQTDRQVSEFVGRHLCIACLASVFVVPLLGLRDAILYKFKLLKMTFWSVLISPERLRGIDRQNEREIERRKQQQLCGQLWYVSFMVSQLLCCNVIFFSSPVVVASATSTPLESIHILSVCDCSVCVFCLSVCLCVRVSHISLIHKICLMVSLPFAAFSYVKG